MLKLKKILSYILVISMILPLIPIGEIKAYAYDEKEFRIDSVTLYKIYDRNRQLTERRVLIRGKFLKDASVGIITNKQYKELTNRTINQDTILQFDLKGDEVGDTLVVGSAEITLNEGSMPTLTQVSRKVESGIGDLILKGTNFQNVGSEVKVILDQGGATQDITNLISGSSEEVIITGITGALGIQDIVFKKETTTPYDFNEKNKNVDVKVNITYTYENQFLLYQNIIVNNLEMRPNRGMAGETVFFEAPLMGTTTDLQEYDVFFLKAIDGTDNYKLENKGKNRKFQPKVVKDNKNYSVLTVEVPDKLPVGEYYVVLTNVTDGKDPMEAVTQEMVLGQKFTVIDGLLKSKITDVQPNRGPDTGSTTTISGQFFGSLNIGEFTPAKNEIKIETPVTDVDPKTLKLSYGEGTFGAGENKVDIERATRDIKVLIGGEAVFLTKDDKFDVSFTKEIDRLTVRTSQITDGDTNPIKDVVVETTTTFYKKGGGTIVIRERAERKNGYTYILSQTKPEITSITPEKIQVVSTGISYEIPEERMVAIHGKNFLIHKYTNDKGEEVLRYPKIEIGNIVIDKNTDKDLYVKILDDKGNELDGTERNELGSKILIRLPKETKVSRLGKEAVTVTNPIRNSNQYGLFDKKIDFVEFVLTQNNENPVITDLKPDTVPVEGGDLVTITGTNFQQGVKVFIDGEEIKSIKRREDGKEITFTAPKGREGETQLQVMNPQGGMDTRPFFYVKTFTNPKIIDFAPKKGNTGTIVMIKGDNFLKPDPMGTEENVYRLVGTRVLLGDVELNEYNRNPQTKRIEVREFTPKEILFTIEDGSVKAADYYHGLLLKDDSGKYYIIDVKPNGEITLSDGGMNTFKIEQEGDKIIANKEGGDIHKMDVSTSGITITKPDSGEKIVLKHASLFKVEDGKIVGQRVKIIDRNTIYFTVPILGTPGFYDLTVINPDTKKDSRTGKAGFEYVTQPDLKPKIDSIHPNEGSVEGGYAIDIIGEDFETNIGNKPKVYINGVEVPDKDTNVSIDGKTITVIVPKYQGDLREDKDTDRWGVPVVVVNPDGSTASEEKGFFYVVPASRPNIEKIVPQKGSAAGGDIVEITGFDFRFYEPYDDRNRDQMWNPGEKYNDLNKNGVWDDLMAYTGEEREVLAEKTPFDHPQFNYYYKSPILPKVYFGDKEAKIVEFSRGYLKVITPEGQPGKTDVFILNNDGGISNKVGFTYEATSVSIDSVIPNQGKKQGGDKVEIHGKGFTLSEMEIYKDDSTFEKKNMPLVKFGNISNRNIDRDKENGGRIDNKRATVNLAGGLRVEYNGNDNRLTLIIEEGDEIYRKEIQGYDNTKKYIPIDLLKSGDKSYEGKELIKVSIEDKRLIVERGYAPKVTYRSSIHLTLETPSYYTIGSVPIFVINPDGGTGEGKFEYKNPDSYPTITNITRDGRDPIEEYRKEINGTARVLRVNYKGGSILTIEGTDFREKAIVKISNLLTMTEKEIDYSLPTKLTFVMPPVPETEVGKLLPVVVQNTDGASAVSDKNIPPIFIEITKGESDPEIISVDPNKGSATGGTKVKIIGNDFRETIKGYEGEKLRVFFGEEEVKESSVKFIDYRTLEVIAPSSKKLGQVPVRIENPDGSITQGNVNFNYISKPKIEKVSPNKLFTNDTKTEVTLTGVMFQTGAKVIVGGKIVDKKDIKQGMDIKGEGIIGVDGAGNNREVAVVGGNEAATVKVEGDKTIKVTFKEGNEIEKPNIIIINPDGGISDPYDKFNYEKPVPMKPLVLEGIPGYESTVQLIWSKSDENILNKATRYEIYGKIAKDKDYTFIGDTAEAEFLVKGLELSTEYIFMVRALNEHGSAIDFATVKVRTLNIRQDEKLREKEEKLREEESKLKSKGKEEILDGKMVITLGSDTFIGGAGTVDLSLSKYKKHDKFIVSIPIEYGRKDTRVTVRDGNMTLILSVKDLYTLAVSRVDQGNTDGYLRIHLNRTNEPHIPRGKKAASKAYEVFFDYMYGKNFIEIGQLLRSGKVFIEEDSILYPNRKNVSIYRFSEETGEYTSLKSTTVEIRGKSKYILLSDR